MNSCGTFSGKNKNKTRRFKVKSKLVKSTIMAASLVGVAACQKPNTTASQSKVATSVTMTASSKAAGVAANTLMDKILSKVFPSSIANVPANLVDGASPTSHNITLTEFWVVIKSLEFKAAETKGQEGSDDADENQFKGPYYVDMLSPNPLALDTQAITPKVYHRVKMQLEAAGTNLPANVPVQMATNSLYLAGAISGTSFSYLSDDGSEIDIAGPSGVDGTANQDILISVKIADIIKKIDFSALLAATNKNIDHTNRVSGSNLCPLIDASALDYYTCFRKGLETEADMGKDSNGDHELGSNEAKVK